MRHLHLSLSWITAIAQFLNIEYGPYLLKSSMPWKASSLGGSKSDKSGLIVQNSRKWMGYFDDSMVSQLEHIGGELLNKLGYETRWCKGSIAPPRWKLKSWEIADYANVLYVHVKRRGLIEQITSPIGSESPRRVSLQIIFTILNDF